mmetsp:Transcript_2826/g.12109  ORF Transcript_2826/g.12109 Transcript_2826/m.12109 type:complete len:240 (-) Transcript_2826:1691-2410(-)
MPTITETQSPNRRVGSVGILRVPRVPGPGGVHEVQHVRQSRHPLRVRRVFQRQRPERASRGERDPPVDAAPIPRRRGSHDIGEDVHGSELASLSGRRRVVGDVPQRPDGIHARYPSDSVQKPGHRPGATRDPPVPGVGAHQLPQRRSRLRRVRLLGVGGQTPTESLDHLRLNAPPPLRSAPKLRRAAFAASPVSAPPLGHVPLEARERSARVGERGETLRVAAAKRPRRGGAFPPVPGF